LIVFNVGAASSRDKHPGKMYPVAAGSRSNELLITFFEIVMVGGREAASK
jgi:hypothetical protein